MEVIQSFNTTASSDDSFIGIIQNVLDLASQRNPQTNFNTRRIEVVTCLTKLASLLGDFSTPGKIANKVFKIFTKLVRVQSLQDYLAGELKLFLQLNTFFERSFITDETRNEFINLLIDVTRGNLDLDPAHGPSLGRLIKWLLTLCQGPLEDLAQNSLLALTNICRNLASCHNYLNSLNDMRTFLKLNFRKPATPITAIYCTTILITMYNECEVLEPELIEHSLDIAIFGLQNDNQRLKRAGADLFAALVANESTKRLVSNRFCIRDDLSERLPMIFTESNPAATCDAYFSAISLCSGDAIAEMLINYPTYEEVDIKPFEKLSDWIKKPLNFDHHVPMAALKLTTHILKASPEETLVQNTPIFTSIMGILNQKMDKDSPNVECYLEQRRLIFALLLDLIETHSLDSNSILEDCMEEVLVTLDFVSQTPLLRSKHTDLRVEVCFLVLSLLSLIQDEVQHIPMLSGKNYEFLRLRLLFRICVPLVRYVAIPFRK